MSDEQNEGSRIRTAHDRLDTLEDILFGKQGENALVRQVKDNYMLITEHINECRENRKQQREQAEHDRRESKRQFWSLIVAIAGSAIAIILSKIFG